MSFITFNNLLRFEQGIKNILSEVLGSTTLNTTSQDLKGAINELISRFTPAVGEIEMNVTGINPGTKYPGTTWVSWGSGKVPVGVDSAQTEFNTVEKTGGAKTVALSAANNGSHTHTGPLHTHGPGTGSYFSTFSGTMSAEVIGEIAGSGWEIPQIKSSGTWHQPTVTAAAGNGNTGTSGSGTAHNNLQPYITCYMWKRTA